GGGVQSAVRLTADPQGVIVRIRFSRALRIALVYAGLPRVWSFTHYWNLPPEDVPQLNVRAAPDGFELDDCKTFGRVHLIVPGHKAVYSDVQAWLDGDAPVQRGRAGVAVLDVRAGDEVVWHGTIGCQEQLRPLGPHGLEAAWKTTADSWNQTWQAAFTPGNSQFSGHLPTYEQASAHLGHDAPPLDRLYSM